MDKPALRAGIHTILAAVSVAAGLAAMLCGRAQKHPSPLSQGLGVFIPPAVF